MCVFVCVNRLFDIDKHVCVCVAFIYVYLCVCVWHVFMFICVCVYVAFIYICLRACALVYECWVCECVCMVVMCVYGRYVCGGCVCGIYFNLLVCKNR